MHQRYNKAKFNINISYRYKYPHLEQCTICTKSHVDIKCYYMKANLEQIVLFEFHLKFWNTASTLGSWREFGCRDDANAWRKSTKEADKHKNFFLQFRK